MHHIFSAVTALLFVGTAYAQEVDSEFGREIFLTYCWQCHGSNASGNGPMAEMLAISPPDLRALAKRNGGSFPTEQIARKIDGRTPTLAHGGEMPIYGAFLDNDKNVDLLGSDGQTSNVSLPLADLVAYLNSIQLDQP